MRIFLIFFVSSFVQIFSESAQELISNAFPSYLLKIKMFGGNNFIELGENSAFPGEGEVILQEGL